VKDKSVMIKGCNWHVFCNGVWHGAYENIKGATELIALLPHYHSREYLQPITLIDLS